MHKSRNKPGCIVKLLVRELLGASSILHCIVLFYISTSNINGGLHCMALFVSMKHKTLFLHAQLCHLGAFLFWPFKP